MSSLSISKLKIILIPLFIGLFFSLLNISPYLFHDNMCQDDFRQSYFWVWKYWDKDLFKNCFYVDMYQSHLVRTPILNFVFKIGHYFTDSLIFYSKILAIFVGTISTIFAYLFFYELTKNKILSFIFILFMSNFFWFTDHVPNGCTRSYLWAGLYLYMYFKLAGKNIAASSLCFILMLLSPFTFLLCMGMEFYNLIIRINYRDFIFSIKQNFIQITTLFSNAISVMFLYLVVFKDIKTQAKGEMFTKAELMKLPEFNKHGRHPIFGASLTDGSWFYHKHWGIPLGDLEIWHKIIFLIFTLIIIFYLYSNKNKIKNIFLSYPIVLFYSSLTLYFLAQILFPTLFMPNRYLVVPLLLLSILVLFLLFNELVNFLRNKNKSTLLVYGFFGILLFSFLFFGRGMKADHFVKMTPRIKTIAENTPKDSLFLAHPKLNDINLVSAIAKRSVFVDSERSIAYSKDALDEIRRRTKVSFKIIYSPSRDEVIKLMEKNGITHLLVHKYFYSKKYLNKPWYYRPYNKFLKDLIKLNRKKGFFLNKILKEKNKKYIVLSLNEIRNLK